MIFQIVQLQECGMNIRNCFLYKIVELVNDDHDFMFTSI